jgi:hypothetical protein
LVSVAALAFWVFPPHAEGQGSIAIPDATWVNFLAPGGGADRPPVPRRVLTNAVYLQLEQAEKDGDPVKIWGLVPQIDTLQPGDPIAYIYVLREAARWAAQQTAQTFTARSADEALRAMLDRLTAERLAGRSNSALGISEWSFKPDPRNLELWRLRTNVLIRALQKPWPAVGASSYLTVVRRLVSYATLFASEDLMRPLLLPLADYAGRIRAGMVPQVTALPPSTSGDSAYGSYLSKVAWGTNSDPGTRGLRGMPPELARLMSAINNAALAGLLRKEGDPLSLSTARAITQGGTLLDAAGRDKVVSVEHLQRDLRLTDVEIVNGLINHLARIPTNSPENIKFLEQAATAARLLPEERQKIGLQ